jgi:hypothetical protein
LCALGPDLAAVWAATTTTPRDRKELLGTLIEEMIVKVERDKSSALLASRVRACCSVSSAASLRPSTSRVGGKKDSGSK